MPEPQCDENEHYTCFNADCQDTCHNSDTSENCDNAIDQYHANCSWGCACMEGFVLGEGGNCVPKTDCECYLSTTDKMYPPNSVVLQGACNQECECIGKEWDCKDYSCPDSHQQSCKIAYPNVSRKIQKVGKVSISWKSQNWKQKWKFLGNLKIENKNRNLLKIS